MTTNLELNPSVFDPDSIEFSDMLNHYNLPFTSSATVQDIPASVHPAIEFPTIFNDSLHENLPSRFQVIDDDTSSTPSRNPTNEQVSLATEIQPSHGELGLQPCASKRHFKPRTPEIRPKRKRTGSEPPEPTHAGVSLRLPKRYTHVSVKLIQLGDE